MAKRKKAAKSAPRAKRASVKTRAQSTSVKRKTVLPTARTRKHADTDRARDRKSPPKGRRKTAKKTVKKTTVKKTPKLADVVSKRELAKLKRSQAGKRGWITQRLKKAERALALAEEKAEKARQAIEAEKVSAKQRIKREKQLADRDRRFLMQQLELNKLLSIEQQERLAIQAESIEDLQEDIENLRDEDDIRDRMFQAEIDGTLTEEAYQLADDYGYSISDIYDIYHNYMDVA